MASRRDIEPLKISIVGSGNWGAAIATIIGRNASRHSAFKETVSQWVFEEMVDGHKLSALINTTHENKKYLPGIQLPSNIRAVPDLVDAVADADLLVFVLPHQFLPGVLRQLARNVKPTTRAISLIKGFHIEEGRPELFSTIISKALRIECCILSGANVAGGVAKGEFSESTLGCSNSSNSGIWMAVFDTASFKINSIPDISGVEVCGAVKNVIALAAGFCDGLGLSTNTKAAIIRLGVEEMKLFAQLFFDGVLEETFYDSAGYADTITTCFGGRNVRCAAEYVKRRPCATDPEIDQKLWDGIEKELLNGQKLQGTLTAKEVYQVIEHHKVLDYFPLFTITHHIAFRGIAAKRVVEIFMTEHSRPPKTLQECHPCQLSDHFKYVKQHLNATTHSRM